MLPQTSSPRVLVVDDEVKNVKLLEAMLVPHGYQIEKAYNGQEALQQVHHHRPDVIILDVMMPVMDGFEVCRRLKEDAETRLIPIVIMTALGQVDDRIKGKEAGADDFLTKPVDRRELMARLQSLIRMNQAIATKVNKLERIKKSLTHFVPASVARSVSENPTDFILRQEQKDISVLFVDISGYTRLSESLPNEHVGSLVEKLFSSFIDRIHVNGGEIGNTAGDGMMVMFGSDDPADHAAKAVRTALEFVELTRRRENQPASVATADGKHEPVSIHIGIHSGQALVGPSRIEGTNTSHWVYTALGSVVNLAARIGAYARDGTILVSEETARRVQGRFVVEEIGRQTFKNVSEPVAVFQIIGPAQKDLKPGEALL